MKKTIQLFMSFLMWCLVAGLIGANADKIGVSAGVAEFAFLVATIVYAYRKVQRASCGSNNDIARADVAVEQWVAYIIERLFKNNMFLNYAYDDDQYVIGGKIVHIPQPGAAPTVRKNNNSYPVASVQRTDTDVTYVLDTYTTDPAHVPDVDLAVISYDKVASIVEDHYGFLLQNVADDMIYKWLNGLSNLNVIRTTGAATAVTTSGQAGNRAAMTFKELQKARLLLNKQNVAQDGRFAEIQSDLLQQMLDTLSATQYRDFTREYDVKEGSIGRLFGFDIMERSTVGTVQDNIAGGLVANDYLTAAGATDQVACICWQKNAVARALGERKMFQRLGDPNYYGDIYSTLTRMGGRRRRADDAGVVAIIQAAA